jgi:hypothetical protein
MIVILSLHEATFRKSVIITPERRGREKTKAGIREERKLTEEGEWREANPLFSSQ